MRISAGWLILCASTQFACQSAGDVSDSSDGPSELGSAPSDPNPSGSPSPKTNSDSPPNATTANAFATTHAYVGCSEIGMAQDGRVLIAGRGKATALTSTGQVDTTFGQAGVLAPADYVSNGTAYWFFDFALDGTGTGLFGITRSSPSNSIKGVFRFDAAGAVVPSFPAPAQAGGTQGARSSRADSTGTLFTTYRSAGQGAASDGVYQVTAAGVASRFVHESFGGGPPARIGPFSSVREIAHHGSEHYLLGVASTDSASVVHKIEADGTASAAFSRIQAPAGALLRVGSGRLYLVEPTRVSAWSRTDGSSIPFPSGSLSLPSGTLGAVADEQDGVFVTQGNTVVRYTASAALDASFGPAALSSPPSGATQEIIFGLAPGGLLVSQCVVSGGVSTQTTYRFAR